MGRRHTVPITLHQGPCAHGSDGVLAQSALVHTRSTRMAPTIAPCGSETSGGMPGHCAASSAALGSLPTPVCSSIQPVGRRIERFSMVSMAQVSCAPLSVRLCVAASGDGEAHDIALGPFESWAVSLS